MDALWPVLLLLGISSTGFAYAATKQMPLRLRVRVVTVAILATAIAIAVGNEPGLVIVCVALPLQMYVMQLANVLIGRAARSNDAAALRRAWQLSRVALWPDGGTGLRSVELLALERNGRFDDLADRVAELSASGDDELIVLAAPWMADSSSCVGSARALLERDVDRFAAAALPIIVAADPTGGIDLVEKHFAVFEHFHVSPWALHAVLCLDGRVDAVVTLCDLVKPSREAREAAILRALAVSGRHADYERAKAAAASDANPRLRSLAARTDALRAGRSSLSAHHVAVIDRVELLVRERAQVDRREVPARPVVTTGLVLACLAGFGVELAKGSTTDDAVLERSGAFLVADRHLSGGWWRALSATFLHAGPAHLLLNVFVFAVIGARFERRFGRAALLAMWLIGALGGAVAVLAASRGAEMVVVGASTSIMAVIGGLVAAALREWRRSRSPQSRALFLRLAAIVALQGVIDQMIPQVSAAGHAGGFVAGFVLMLGFGDRFDRATRAGGGSRLATRAST